MSKVISLHKHQKVAEEASNWIAVLDGGGVEKEHLDKFNAWYLESPAHAKAFHELAGLWGDMESLTELSHLMPLHQEPQKPSRSNWNMAFGVLASLTLIIATLVSFPGHNSSDIWQSGDLYSQKITTAVGESISITLPDKSLIQLNTGTSIQVVYNQSYRAIWLEAGEAHFEVAKNPDLPFIVHAAGGTVKAVGTAFNVHLAANGVEVLVTEGEVEVTPLATKLIANDKPENIAKSASLIAGQQTYYADNFDEITEVKPEIIDRELAWQRGMIIFEGEPIVEAIDEINRYTNRNIVISDPTINDIRVGGYFQIGEVDAMLEVFEQSFGIEVTYAGREIIMLSARKDIL